MAWFVSAPEGGESPPPAARRKGAALRLEAPRHGISVRDFAARKAWSSKFPVRVESVAGRNQKNHFFRSKQFELSATQCYCIHIHRPERWLSGRKHRFAKPARGKPLRGFESLSLRHLLLFPVKRSKTRKAKWRGRGSPLPLFCVGIQDDFSEVGGEQAPLPVKRSKTRKAEWRGRVFPCCSIKNSLRRK